MRFLKLDTGVIRNFDAALGSEVDVFPTRLSAVLRSLRATSGWAGMFRAIARALSGSSGVSRDASAGNLLRKQIRLPKVFGNPVLGRLYAAAKRLDAALLHQALEAHLDANAPETFIIYNGSNYPESVLAGLAERRDAHRVYIEAGYFPNTLQIDPKGLNGANSVPRDPEFYLSGPVDFAEIGLPQAVNNRASKRRSGGEIALEPGYVFVPFQVPSDMQVTLHSPWVRSMLQFLDVVIAAAEANPAQTFVIKEHPSFKRSVKGTRPDHPRVIFANENVTSELIEGAKAVVTLNSTVGIEALLLERPVITLGRACYNVEGLVLHAPHAAALADALHEIDNGWKPEDRLRRQYLGYLCNYYLVRGSYDDLPANLAQILEDRARSGGYAEFSGGPTRPS